MARTDVVSKVIFLGACPGLTIIIIATGRFLFLLGLLRGLYRIYNTIMEELYKYFISQMKRALKRKVLKALRFWVAAQPRAEGWIPALKALVKSEFKRSAREKLSMNFTLKFLVKLSHKRFVWLILGLLWTAMGSALRKIGKYYLLPVDWDREPIDPILVNRFPVRRPLLRVLRDWRF